MQSIVLTHHGIEHGTDRLVVADLHLRVAPVGLELDVTATVEDPITPRRGSALLTGREEGEGRREEGGEEKEERGARRRQERGGEGEGGRRRRREQGGRREEKEGRGGEKREEREEGGRGRRREEEQGGRREEGEGRGWGEGRGRHPLTATQVLTRATCISPEAHLVSHLSVLGSYLYVGLKSMLPSVNCAKAVPFSFSWVNWSNLSNRFIW